MACAATAGAQNVATYTDLTLDRALSIAAEKNRDLLDARSELAKAEAQITEAASAAYPSINGFWNAEQVLKPMIFVIEFPDENGVMRKNRLQAGTDYTMGVGAALNQNIWVGGKIGAALKAAKIYRTVAQNNLKAAKQAIAAGVIQAFDAVLLAGEMLDITRQSLDQAQRHLENVQSLYDAGSATKYDLLRARVQVANMKPKVLDAENQVTVATLSLKQVLGISPDSELSVMGRFEEPDLSLLDKATPETALENRPDLAATEKTVDLYEKNVTIARGDFLPTLTAGSTFQYSGNFDVFKYDAEDWNPYWTAGVNLSFPIFSGFRNSAKYRQAKTDFYTAKRSYRRMYDVVLIEVEQAVLTFRNAIESIESQRMNVEEAEMAIEMAESLYTNGKATQLEVLDAQLALESARTNMVTAMHQASVAEINLKKSLGLLADEIK